MRRLSAIAFIILIAGLSPAHAADPSQVFGTILGEIGAQIEKKQRKKQQKQQLKHWRLLWSACLKGDVAACDAAAQFPNLDDQARADILRMREAAMQRPEYERNFYACQKMNRVACQAALSYSYASDVDRANLQKWQRAANEQYQRLLTKFRQHERNCFAGSIADCDAALSQDQLNEHFAADLQRQRARLQLANEKRQLRERQLKERQIEEERQRQRQLQAQRLKEQRLKERQFQERQREERRRKAALREYQTLRDKCAAGDRRACRTAAAHPFVPKPDIAFLNSRDRELAPILERIMTFVANAENASTQAGVPINKVGLALLGVLAVIGAVAGIHHGLRNRGAATTSASDQPPRLDPEPAVAPQARFGEEMFPLTGDMATDVRRALYGVQQ